MAKRITKEEQTALMRQDPNWKKRVKLRARRRERTPEEMHLLVMHRHVGCVEQEHPKLFEQKFLRPLLQLHLDVLAVETTISRAHPEIWRLLTQPQHAAQGLAEIGIHQRLIEQHYEEVAMVDFETWDRGQSGYLAVFDALMSMDSEYKREHSDELLAAIKAFAADAEKKRDEVLAKRKAS